MKVDMTHWSILTPVKNKVVIPLACKTLSSLVDQKPEIRTLSIHMSVPPDFAVFTSLFRV